MEEDPGASLSHNPFVDKLVQPFAKAIKKEIRSVNGSQVDLAELFAFTQRSLAAHKQEINDLDGYNGNHGDNMVQNVQMIVDALQRHRSDPPAAALKQASQCSQTERRGRQVGAHQRASRIS